MLSSHSVEKTSRQTHAANINTPAQNYQDLFVLFQLKLKKGGFFVEFGATNGVGLSNTLLLERKFGWSGIVVEPGRRWLPELKANRSCIIDSRCVWSETGKIVDFLDAKIGELSTIKGFEDRDSKSDERRENVVYPVGTVSLNDLLSEHNDPAVIDYISVDTEGTEFDILNAFDFARYKVKIFTIEHNYVQSDRQRIKDLMERNGFSRHFVGFSKWDDWYVSTRLPAE
jgi:FkbM family methyltransferase